MGVSADSYSDSAEGRAAQGCNEGDSVFVVAICCYNEWI